MSHSVKSLLSASDLSDNEIESLFSQANQFKVEFNKSGAFFSSSSPLASVAANGRAPIVAEAFFETSTRTRMSFQMAARRLGLSVAGMELMTGSSVKKGESVCETLRTLDAMAPDILVIRSQGGVEVDDCIRSLSVPVINAGAGTFGHPTQALLDAFTLQEKLGSLSGLKLLMVGDVEHSRVANSNFRLLSRLGVEIGLCGPDLFMPNSDEWAQVKRFGSLEEGLSWSNAVMALRVQVERHSVSGSFDRDKYVREYCLTPGRLESLPSDGYIMHPGPFVAGVDLSLAVLEDERCLIRTQVSNGVFVRAAIFCALLNLDKSL